MSRDHRPRPILPETSRDAPRSGSPVWQRPVWPPRLARVALRQALPPFYLPRPKWSRGSGAAPSSPAPGSSAPSAPQSRGRSWSRAVGAAPSAPQSQPRLQSPLPPSPSPQSRTLSPSRSRSRSRSCWNHSPAEPVLATASSGSRSPGGVASSTSADAVPPEPLAAAVPGLDSATSSGEESPELAPAPSRSSSSGGTATVHVPLPKSRPRPSGSPVSAPLPLHPPPLVPRRASQGASGMLSVAPVPGSSDSPGLPLPVEPSSAAAVPQPWASCAAPWRASLQADPQPGSMYPRPVRPWDYNRRCSQWGPFLVLPEIALARAHWAIRSADHCARHAIWNNERQLRVILECIDIARDAIEEARDCA